MTRIRLTRDAERDLEQAQLDYEARAPGLGNAFLDEVRDTLRHVAEFPDSAERIDATCRRAVVNRFPFVIVYRKRRKAIEVGAIFPSRANPVRLSMRLRLFH